MMTREINGLIARGDLTQAQKHEMFALLSAYFEGVTIVQFERDLAEKNWVIEIRRGGRLLGFSTLLVMEENHEGEALTVMYSGDTIVAPEAWSSPALARTWIAAVNHLRARFTAHPCYWLLLTSGFRTYRFLPVFWREFYPRHGVVTPPRHQRLLEYLARARYGAAFDVGSRVVRFPHPQCLREPPAGRAGDADVEFFLRRNPGHAQGDELVCLTEISESNLTAAGRRMVGA